MQQRLPHLMSRQVPIRFFWHNKIKERYKYKILHTISDFPDMPTTFNTDNNSTWWIHTKLKSVAACWGVNVKISNCQSVLPKFFWQTTAEVPLKPRCQIKAHRDTCSWSFAKPRGTCFLGVKSSPIARFDRGVNGPFLGTLISAK